MFIYMIGWHWEHKEGFAIERPDGHFGTQLIVVQSKGRIVMGDREYRVGKNTAFLVKSCMPHSLYSDGEDYCDDWIRFNLEQKDMEFIDGLDIEFNVPVSLKDDSISKLIAASEEIFNSDLTDKKAILDNIMRAIILELNGYYRPRAKTKHNYYDEELEKLRREIYSHPEREWNIPDIAAQLSISVPHFQRLYKSLYGISCMKDVWTSRMEYAKQLLLNTDLSANTIAEKCGYQSYEYFSRSFTKYACISPVKYRTKNKE